MQTSKINWKSFAETSLQHETNSSKRSQDHDASQTGVLQQYEGESAAVKFNPKRQESETTR